MSVGKLSLSKGSRLQGRALTLSEEHSSPSLLPKTESNKLFNKAMVIQVNYCSPMCHPLWYHFCHRYFTSIIVARGAQPKGRGWNSSMWEFTLNECYKIRHMLFYFISCYYVIWQVIERKANKEPGTFCSLQLLCWRKGFSWIFASVNVLHLPWTAIQMLWEITNMLS